MPAKLYRHFPSRAPCPNAIYSHAVAAVNHLEKAHGADFRLTAQIFLNDFEHHGPSSSSILPYNRSIAAEILRRKRPLDQSVLSIAGSSKKSGFRQGSSRLHY